MLFHRERWWFLLSCDVRVYTTQLCRRSAHAHAPNNVVAHHERGDNLNHAGVGAHVAEPKRVAWAGRVGSGRVGVGRVSVARRTRDNARSAPRRLVSSRLGSARVAQPCVTTLSCAALGRLVLAHLGSARMKHGTRLPTLARAVLGRLAV